MSFKRARVQELSTDHQAGRDSFEEDAETSEAAQKFRNLLIQNYLDGSTSASDTVQLAYWHCQSGGRGGEELALHPRNASRHAAEHLRPRFDSEPGLFKSMCRFLHPCMPEVPPQKGVS